MTHFPALLLCSAPTDRDHISPGRSWCTTKDNKCPNKKDKCYPFTDKDLLSALIALGWSDDSNCPFEAQFKKEQAACIKNKCSRAEEGTRYDCYQRNCEGGRYARKGGTDCSIIGPLGRFLDSTYRTKWPYSFEADPLSYLMGLENPDFQHGGDYDGFIKSSYAKEDYAKAFECIGDGKVGNSATGSNKNVWCTGQKKCVKNAKPGACTSCSESTQHEPQTMGCEINGTKYKVYVPPLASGPCSVAV